MARRKKLDLVTGADIAQMCGVSRAAVCNWATQFEDWPDTAADVTGGPIYWRADVLAFHSPPAAQGGTGAVLVLLEKR